MGNRRRRATRGVRYSVIAASRHAFGRVDAPDIRSLDPAGDVAGLDTAPAATAFEQLCHDPGLGPREQRGPYIGALPDATDVSGDDDLAAIADHFLVDPAVGALPVAHMPPVIERAQHLDWPIPAHKHPVDRIAVARPLAHEN